MDNYTSVLNIPKGKSGKWEIKHKIIPAGDKITVVSMRDALFSGKKPYDAICVQDIKVTQLFEDGGLWMSDSPQEQELHKEVVKKCKGDVLIGGLGIGYIVTLLANKKDVSSVT